MAGMKFFTHFVGYVVDREDGQNLGRVKVKALGFHDLDSKVISADDLPWAPVVDGTYGAVSSIPQIGDWVLGAFLDGADAQHPIVLGRIPGYNSQAPSGTETNGTEVAEYANDPNLFGKFPLHPVLGGEGIDELEGLLSAATATRKDDNDLKDSIERKHTEEVAMRPERDLDNRVMASTDDQNYVLLTDTDGGHIQIVHHKGTVIQINEDGDVLIKSRGGMQNMVDGGLVEQIDGDFNTMIGQDYTLKVDNNGKMYFRNDLDIECENFSLTVRGDTLINTKGTHVQKSFGNMMINSGDDMDIVSEKKLKVQSLDLTTIQSDNHGIYLYATGAQNKIDMTSGSLKMTTEIKPNTAIPDFTEADTHELGTIDIQSANNMFIETKGAPADSPPSPAEIEDSDGFLNVKTSAGMRFATVSSDNGKIHLLSSDEMHIKSTNKMVLESDATTHINGTTTYIDDVVRMAEGGAAGEIDPNGAGPSTEAMISSLTRKNVDDDDDLQKANAAGGLAPMPPDNQGVGGYKVPDSIPIIPNPGNTSGSKGVAEEDE
jgi:hypothetical protein